MDESPEIKNIVDIWVFVLVHLIFVTLVMTFFYAKHNRRHRLETKKMRRAIKRATEIGHLLNRDNSLYVLERFEEDTTTSPMYIDTPFGRKLVDGYLSPKMATTTNKLTKSNVRCNDEENTIS